jgi:hypothetical protein
MQFGMRHVPCYVISETFPDIDAGAFAAENFGNLDTGAWQIVLWQAYDLIKSVDVKLRLGVTVECDSSGCRDR